MDGNAVFSPAAAERPAFGALYALLAFGYVLTNGVLHRTNLAHGAVFAFGGQTMILAAVFGWQGAVADPAGIVWHSALPSRWATARSLASCCPGACSSRWSNAVPNTIVAATLGVAIVLMEGGRIAAETRDFWLPPLLATPVVFAADGPFRVTLTVTAASRTARLRSCSLALARGYWPALSFGRRWRAVSDDPGAAAMWASIRAASSGSRWSPAA